jgi:flagellar M-ring protein FliF
MLKPFTDFWKGLEKSQKTRIYITSGLVTLAVVVGLFLLTRPTYTTLIENADDEAIASMQKVLNDKGISYKLTDDKKGIIVNKKDSDQAHFELVNAGTLKDGLTFADALGNIKINTTESDKKHIWQHLDESDIVRQLKLFKNVNEASVKITQPEKTLFIDETKNNDVKAAVTIIPNGEITPKQAQSIVKIVASSVEGLDPKNVTVVDDKNNFYSSDEDSSIEKTSTQYEQKLRVKSDLEKNAKTVLSDLFDSFDLARVVVNPVLDFDTLKQTSKEVSNPTGMESGALISKQEKKEDLKNGDTGSTPGVNANPGTTPSYPMGSTDAKSFKSSDTTENWVFNETNKQSEKSLGEVVPEKTTAAITLLYGSRIKDDSKLTTQFIGQVQDLVSKATGIPAANIAVTKLAIQPPQAEKTSLADTIKALVNQYGLLTLLMIMFLVLIIISMPKRKKKPVPAFELKKKLFQINLLSPILSRNLYLKLIWKKGPRLKNNLRSLLSRSRKRLPNCLETGLPMIMSSL